MPTKLIDDLLTTIFCSAGIMGFLVLVSGALSAIRIVPNYRRLVVFRLGRCVGKRGPGCVLLIPWVENAVTVDLREQVRETLRHSATTRDGKSVAIDFMWFFKVASLKKRALIADKFEVIAHDSVITILHSIISDIPSDKILSEREYIGDTLYIRLGQVAERWGVEVLAVGIGEIALEPDDGNVVSV